MIGNQYKYVKTEVDRKRLDYEFPCSPKALCIDIKIDIVAWGDTDFNIMLPCIPYDRIEPNEKGEWVFEVHISGSTAYNSKNAECIPSLPGAILSTSNKIYMNNPEIIDGPLIKFGKGTDYTEDRILNYYIIWAKGMASHKKNLRFLYGIDNINQLRPDYD